MALNPPTVRLRLDINASGHDFVCWLYEQTAEDLPHSGRIVDQRIYHGAIDVEDLVTRLKGRINGLQWDQLSLFDLEE